jgi:hypothetical protein
MKRPQHPPTVPRGTDIPRQTGLIAAAAPLAGAREGQPDAQSAWLEWAERAIGLLKPGDSWSLPRIRLESFDTFRNISEIRQTGANYINL